MRSCGCHAAEDGHRRATTQAIAAVCPLVVVELQESGISLRIPCQNHSLGDRFTGTEPFRTGTSGEGERGSSRSRSWQRSGRPGRRRPCPGSGGQRRERRWHGRVDAVPYTRQSLHESGAQPRPRRRRERPSRAFARGVAASRRPPSPYWQKSRRSRFVLSTKNRSDRGALPVLPDLRSGARTARDL